MKKQNWFKKFFSNLFGENKYKRELRIIKEIVEMIHSHDTGSFNYWEKLYNTNPRVESRDQMNKFKGRITMCEDLLRCFKTEKKNETRIK